MDILQALNIKDKDGKLPVIKIPSDIEIKEISYNGETISVPLDYYNQAKKELLSFFSKDYIQSSFMDSVMQKNENVLAYDITYTIPVTLSITSKLTRYSNDDYLYEITLNDFSILAGYVFNELEMGSNVHLLLTQISDPRYTQGRNNLSMSLHIEITDTKEGEQD